MDSNVLIKGYEITYKGTKHTLFFKATSGKLRNELREFSKNSTVLTDSADLFKIIDLEKYKPFINNETNLTEQILPLALVLEPDKVPEIKEQMEKLRSSDGDIHVLQFFQLIIDYDKIKSEELKKELQEEITNDYESIYWQLNITEIEDIIAFFRAKIKI